MYVIVIVVPFLNMLYLMLASYNPRITINTILINNLISFLVSLLIFYEVVLSGQICLIQGPVWISSSVFQVNLGFLFDALSTVLVMLVSFISLLVQIYSREYMSSDPHLLSSLLI